VVLQDNRLCYADGYSELYCRLAARRWTGERDHASLSLALSRHADHPQHFCDPLQNVYYNAFTPPPNNLASSGYQWTTGSVYYPTIIMAELFGSSNQSQIVDLGADNNNEYHPAYAVYENGVPTRIALINFVSDASGANDLTVTIDMGGQPFPKQTVDVR
jgi:hypothetical protein